MKAEEVLDKVKDKLEISEEERAKINELVKEILEVLENKRKELGIEALIEVQGSFAHDTWLKEDKDIDIFILGRSDNIIEDALKLAKYSFPNHIERYAEHPFITVPYKGYNFDIVPAYLIEKGEKIRTAADRTRLHTSYLLEVLNDKLRKEIRLLKLFLKTLDLYGAEIKVGGLSGYLCELLIIHYGSFMNLVRSSLEWKPYKVIIGDWKGRPEPIVVVDPVDPNRNVASSFKKFDLFKFGCLLFLENPSTIFFEGRKYCSDLDLALEIFEGRASEALVVEFEYPKIAPDQFWGEIQRAQRSLTNFLIINGFEILDSLTYSDEKEKAAILIEVKSKELSKFKIHEGPLLFLLSHARAFIRKHRNEPISLKDGRLFATTKRKITSIDSAIKKWALTQSLPKDLIKSLKNAKIYSAEEAQDLGIKRRILDLALKDLWWVREDLIKSLNIKLE